MKHFSAIATTLILAAPSALATDYYVDAVNGSDANTGTSPAAAWRTITFASTATGAGDLIHLAPGTYSTASGETFPLRFNHQSIVGDAGPGSTVIDAGGAVAIEMRQVYQTHGGTTTQPTSLTRMSGVTARNASTFALMSTEWLHLNTTFSDMRIENVSGACFQASAGAPLAAWSVELTLENVDCSQAHSATLVSLTSVTGVAAVRASGCDFSNAGSDAIRSTSNFSVDATFDRCRFTHSPGAAFQAGNSPGGRTSVTFRDCLLARNGSGFFQDSSDASTRSTVQLERCTVADNTTFGIRNTGSQSTTVLDGVILAGNGVDFSATSPSIQFSWISAGNPLFVDPANDDYRLRFGSPCIDQGHPGSGSGSSDLAGTTRQIDGDLDTNERGDIGAFEHQPLRLVTTGQIGTPLRLESSGPAGGSTTVHFTRGSPLTPTSTPFGQFDLDPAAFGTLVSMPVMPFPPAAFQRPIPNNPAMIGRTFSFQALTSSSLAPQGFAYTNAVSFTVVP